jgi:hypothetical protein
MARGPGGVVSRTARKTPPAATSGTVQLHVDLNICRVCTAWACAAVAYGHRATVYRPEHRSAFVVHRAVPSVGDRLGAPAATRHGPSRPRVAASRDGMSTRTCFSLVAHWAVRQSPTPWRTGCDSSRASRPPTAAPRNVGRPEQSRLCSCIGLFGSRRPPWRTGYDSSRACRPRDAALRDGMSSRTDVSFVVASGCSAAADRLGAHGYNPSRASRPAPCGTARGYIDPNIGQPCSASGCSGVTVTGHRRPRRKWLRPVTGSRTHLRSTAQALCRRECVSRLSYV